MPDNCVSPLSSMNKISDQDESENKKYQIKNLQSNFSN